MKLYIWGTGRLVGKVVGRSIDIEDVEAFIDNNANKKEYMGKPVYTPDEVAKMEYDAICVANLFSKEIYAQCQKLGIDLNRVIFLYNNCELKDMNEDYGFVSRILGQEYADTVKRRYHVVRGVEAYGDLCLTDKIRGGGSGKRLCQDQMFRIGSKRNTQEKCQRFGCGSGSVPGRICPVHESRISRQKVLSV